MTQPVLTICIASLHSRTMLLAECLRSLRAPRGIAEAVEILVAIDQGSTPLGTKRNQLMFAARGDFVCCVDDDDTVSPGYLSSVLAAAREHPEVDAISIRGQRTEVAGNPSPVLFDYRLGGIEGEWFVEDGLPIIWRSPGHICPIRRHIVRQIPFDDVQTDEDLVWSARVAPYLRTVARAGKPGEILYHYKWDAHKVFGT